MTDRLFDTFLAAVRKAFPWWGYCATYEYSIFTINGGGAYDLRPTDGSLPPLPSVKFKPGIPGLTALLRVGCLAYVTFINHDSGRPMIVSLADPDDAGFVPLGFTLQASGNIAITSGAVLSADGTSVALGAAEAPVVRVGDTVAIAGASPAVGVITVTMGLGIPPLPSRVLA